jgi:N-acetylmuramoyl-L-alanine amidase
VASSARSSLWLLVALALVLLAACGADPSSTPGSESAAPSVSAEATPQASDGGVIPPPGSDSEVYEPNPGAIVVAIDPGHGGCLDWGVPNPWDNTVDKAEKADTLSIALALRDLLEEQGITVVLTRADDAALAGDDYPDLGCTGPAWRDVDGDGEAGFEETGRIRTRDELQARIDLANLVRADLLLSIHVNSMTQDGVLYEIAATQTFYDDETPWGAERSRDLGREIQRGVVEALDDVARYERQDRGTQAVSYYVVSRAWQDGDTCERPGDTWCKPHRAAQLPSVLGEVGSMSLEAESELLATEEGQLAVAEGLYQGIREWLGQRPLAVRYDAELPGGQAGEPPVAAPGQGPPFWAPSLSDQALTDGGVTIRVTNTGQQPWPPDLRLMVGWSGSELPYLAQPPLQLAAAEVDVPALEPGEAVELAVRLDIPAGGRSLAWFTLADPDGRPFTDLGSPALQLARDGG